MNIKNILFATIIILITSCQKKEFWSFHHDIELEDISPTGIVPVGENQFWLSDTDHNKMFKIDGAGKILSVIEDMDRPMHISSDKDNIYVPEYGSDSIKIIQNGKLTGMLSIVDTPDAPASVDVKEDQYMIADFYNHRVIYQSKEMDKTFGKKGDANGEFHYPTDVQFFNDKLYIADAYNHRIQIFDSDANHIQTIGEAEKMNASTGIFINEDYILTTDFENDRVLTYDHSGKLIDIIDEGLFGPIDILISNNQLYVLNFKGGFISIYDH